MLNRLKKNRLIIFLVIATVLCMLSGLLFGAFPVLFNQGMSPEKWSIILNLRVPRVLCCAIVGALLACCGVISQTILRNPLACPYTLGVSQLVALVLFVFLYLNFSFALALLGLIVIVSIFLYRSIADSISIPSFSASLPKTLILLGLAVGTFCSSIIFALQFALDGISLMQMTRWLMGSMSVVGYWPLLPSGAVLLILFFFACRSAGDLDWLYLGDEIAMSRGVAVKKLTLTFCFLILLSVAFVVWSVGPIGFVGLIIPHAARLLGFFRHRSLLIVSSLLGASFLCLSDVLARTIISPVEIPIGVVTGIIGTPVFVYLLIGSQKNRETVTRSV